MCPWLGFLNYATNCRIFQDKTAVDVIQEVVAQHGYSGLIRFDLTKTSTKLDYCVQYRETDMDFLMRLMASEGIFFYFRHTDGKHVVVLADAPSSYKPLPNLSTLKYAPVLGNLATKDAITIWSGKRKCTPGRGATAISTTNRPTNVFDSMNASPDVAAEGAKFETYQLPGGYSKKFNRVGSVGGVQPEGDKLTRLRMEMEEREHTMLVGVSN